MFTTLKPEKQALGIFLSLEDKARTTIAEMDLKEADDVSKVLRISYSIFKR